MAIGNSIIIIIIMILIMITIIVPAMKNIDRDDNIKTTFERVRSEFGCVVKSNEVLSDSTFINFGNIYFILRPINNTGPFLYTIRVLAFLALELKLKNFHFLKIFDVFYIICALQVKAMVQGRDRRPELGYKLALECRRNINYPMKNKNSKCVLLFIIIIVNFFWSGITTCKSILTEALPRTKQTNQTTTQQR